MLNNASVKKLRNNASVKNCLARWSSCTLRQESQRLLKSVVSPIGGSGADVLWNRQLFSLGFPLE